MYPSLSVSKSSKASFISWRCSSVISWRTFEWSREVEWSCDREEDGVRALCWGEEEPSWGRLRGLVPLPGYIVDAQTTGLKCVYSGVVVDLVNEDLSFLDEEALRRSGSRSRCC